MINVFGFCLRRSITEEIYTTRGPQKRLMEKIVSCFHISREGIWASDRVPREIVRTLRQQGVSEKQVESAL